MPVSALFSALLTIPQLLTGVPRAARPSRRMEWRALGFLLVVFVLMLLVSWRRWVSVIADSGRELDLPLRLLRGEALYRDVHFLYTPFAPYLNAQLYAWFGVRLETLQGSGIGCSLLLGWLCYRIARRLLTPSASALAVCGVIVWCVFKPAGNLISPYSYSALYGVVFALACLLACLRAQASTSARTRLIWLALAGGLSALAILAKQEFALVSGAALLATFWQLRAQPRRMLAGSVLASASVGVPLLLLVFGKLFQQYGWDLLVKDCHLFFTHLPASLRYYNAQRTGLDAPLASLLQIFGGACVALAALCGISWHSLPHAAVQRRRVVEIGVAALVLALLIGGLMRGRWDGSPLRALPLFLLAALWWTRRAPAGTAHGAVFLIAAYSFASLLRVLLRVPSGGAFGSFFLPTSLILLVFALLRALPDWLQQWTADEGVARRAQRAGWRLLAFVLLTTAIVFGIRYRRTYQIPISTVRGTFYAPASAGVAYAQTLAWLQAHTRTTDAIAVFPEGSDLAFFSARSMPLRHQIYLPGLLDAQAEQAIAAQLAQVNHVLLVNRPMREFGAVAFGHDFYPTLGAALTRDFQFVHTFAQPAASISPSASGPPAATLMIGAPTFFIQVLHRHTSTQLDRP